MARFPVRSFRLSVCAASLFACAGFSHSASAQNLFSITATATGQTPVTVGADSIIDLVNSAVNTQNQFAPFQSLNSTFNLNYGGITDAITVTKNSSNTGASLTFGPTGVTRNFTGTSQADLQQQIEDYLKKGAGEDVTNFLKAVNAQSVIAVSDGNPNATTNRMAEYAYNHFGLFGDQFKAYRLVSTDVPPAAQGGGDDAQNVALTSEGAGMQFHFSVQAGTFEAGDFDGESATLSSAVDLNFTKRVGLSVGGFLGYNATGDADVFHGAAVVGVPIRLALPDLGSRFTWQLTPHAVFGGSGSQDIGAGGLIFGGGVTNYLAWHIDDRWTLAMANQYTMYEGEKLSFDDFEIDPGVSQSMMKNGLRATYRFGDRWYAYGACSFTNFLDDAAVESWVSPALGIGYSTIAGTGLQLGVSGDLGDDWTGYSVRLGANFMF